MSSNYGRNSEGEKREYFDNPDQLASHAATLAQWINEANHCIVFTGAGISTSTGIPDFRSGMNTVLETGPGAWELRDAGQQRSKGARVKSTLQAMPSPTHMALVELQRLGKVKLIVSQNCDGLHLRSGLHPDSLAELHGNTNLEKCEKCGRKYLRDFGTRNAQAVKDHFTGRHCDNSECGGKLNDSIINFGENLPAKELKSAFSHANKADLCITLGSSLTVSPANDIPGTVAERGQRLVIVNLQKTPFHKYAFLSIHGMCDDVMRGVMRNLGLEIPTWKLKRRVTVRVTLSSLANHKLSIAAEVTSQHPDCDLPYLIFKSVKMSVKDSNGVQQSVTKKPFQFKLMIDRSKENDNVKLDFELHFFGHYGEPSYNLLESFPAKDGTTSRDVLLLYNPLDGKWSTDE